MRKLALEVLTASDHHRSCCTLPENSLSAGLTPAGVAVLSRQLHLLRLSSICHGAIHFLSSCRGMSRHADKQLSSVTHEVAAWQW